MKIKYFVIFSLCMVIAYTGICTILTAISGIDFSQYYTVFVSVFGGELVCTCILKIFSKEDKKNDSIISDDTSTEDGENDI